MIHDTALIKLGVFAVIAIGRAVAASSRKRNAQNRALRPPQSAPAPPPIAPPGTMQSGPPPSSTKKKAGDGSPWSSQQGAIRFVTFGRSQP